jgi:hypothetical protein
MEALSTEFTRSAFFSDFVQGGDSSTDSEISETDAGTVDVASLSLHFNSSPFKDFIRKVNFLIETDPKEAERVLRTAISDRYFDNKVEKELLNTKLDKVADQVKHEEDGLLLQDNYQQPNQAPINNAPFFARSRAFN